MNYQNLKFAQITILTGVSIYTQNILIMLIAITRILFKLDCYYIATTISIIATIYPFLSQIYQLQIIYFLPFTIYSILCWMEHRYDCQPAVNYQKKLAIFLIFLGLTTINDKCFSTYCQLFLFISILILKIMRLKKVIYYFIIFLRAILIIELLYLSIVIWQFPEYQYGQANNKMWWFLIAFSLAILYATLLINQERSQKQLQSIITSQKSINIQLEDFSQKSKHSQQINNNIQQQINSNLQKNLELSKEQQSQAFNLFLVIPFCLLQQTWISFPIYAYLFALQWGQSKKWLLSIVLISIGFIIAKCDVNSEQDIILRIITVMLATKDLQGGYQIGEFIKMIWLRGSFIFVLGILFWYSLLTVNIFHLLFIAIILLFITKGVGQSQVYSFRHRNWKYLLGLFNLFLILRYIFILLQQYGYDRNQKLQQVLQLTGISYRYTNKLELFNQIPLIINAIIGLQYFTYNSKIYSKHSTSNYLKKYKDAALLVLDTLTVIYYKLLPWVSYFIIISLLLILQSSFSAFILFAWILITLGTHILSKNEPSSYKKLFWLWLFYSRLTSLQIVLRYIFQFAKFDLLSFMKNIPFFQILIQYQELLGLAIRQQQTVYFKTITKFQLMISLDLISIFISFLVTQYYLLLLKFSKLPPRQQWCVEDQKVNDIYYRYVDFKLTLWLQDKKIYKIIRIFCYSLFQLYFPLLGLFCCQNISILSFIYLCLAIKYFLSINFQYYRSHIRSGYASIVLDIVLNWNKQRYNQEIKDLNIKLNNIKQQMQKYKIKQHKRLRLFSVIVTVIAVLLTYISTTLQNNQLLQLIGEETTIFMRWWLLIGGCSLQQGFIGHFSKLMLIILVLEMKCSWFVNKFQIAARKHPPQQQQMLIIKNILTNEDDRDEQQYISEQNEIDGRQINSEILRQQLQTKQQINEMRVSLLLGSLKFLQRSFVMILVFISIILGSHPFGIIYLLCAILLNFLGSISIKVLSRILSILLILQYILIIFNYFNQHFYPNLNHIYYQFQQKTILNILFNLSVDWQWYLTFGKKDIELQMLTISWIIIASYQLYFIALRKTWINILGLIDVQIKLGIIGKRMLQHFRQVYQYILTYSPLVIMLFCLFIYLLDYTVTNLLLTTLTLAFIFVSFLVRDYRQSRHYWRTYFIVLQLLIVFFMVVYSLLQLPMLSTLCNRFLCASEELHTQIYKALLLLILQIGLDLTSSHHFDRALHQFEHSRKKIGLQKLVIAYYNNDKKILQKFKQIYKQKQLQQTIKQVQQFLCDYKQNHQAQFKGRDNNIETKQTWYNIIIQFLPSLIDENLLLTEQKIKDEIRKQNINWMQLKNIKDVNSDQISIYYIDEYAQLQGDQLQKQLRNLLKYLEQKQINNKQNNQRQQQLQQLSQSRKSFIQNKLPIQSQQIVRDMRKTIKNQQQKQQLLYLLLVESVLSNWHYLAYILILLIHINNQGLLTMPIPAVIFCFGMVSSYQAAKQVWRTLFILIIILIVFKFITNLQIIDMDEEIVFLLIGDNKNQDLLEYICIIFIICQCVILKMIGHFDESTEQIQCMKMALIRNIINHNKLQQRQDLFQLLRQHHKMPLSYSDMIFGKSQGKPGYDYSTLLTTLQLTILIWVFLFYDRMAVRQQITFYQMIQYNQFSSGMVALTLFQLLFLLGERFIAIVDLRSQSNRWQVGLIVKYILLILNFLLVQIVILIYFPLSSGQFQGNAYVTVLLVMNILALLVQSLQIKAGLDQSSRGFMDRYTWYNGFIYMGFRAIPFLFQFKAFSDWTFTKTSLRIFDWIRLQQIFGRLYVAKCNSLFLAGKLLGSKIEWWKKLIMGYPLLLSIILLIFGPLVLFSNLNPLASHNDVIAGYLQVILRINKTNEYPLYTNSHITDIHQLNASLQQIQLLKLYDIDLQTVQQLRLQEFSDQYWEISQGSYYKLLDQPQISFYQLIVRAKFHRNQTGMSTLYVLNTYIIQQQNIKQFKQSLLGKTSFCAKNLLPTFLRLDNNDGLHQLGEQYQTACLKCAAGVRASKQYWILQGGLRLRIASDKFTKAIFGYSVMSFYISIILVIANYFRFLFQGTVHTIITSDIPYSDPALAICNAIFRARRNNDLKNQQILFWTLIDLLRSPDTLKSLTGNYLQARLDTLKVIDKDQRKND